LYLLLLQSLLLRLLWWRRWLLPLLLRHRP
jgi:hypothetical protein